MSKNAIWQFFVKVDTDSSKAKCTECNKLLSLGNDIPKLQTTSGLRSLGALYIFYGL